MSLTFSAGVGHLGKPTIELTAFHGPTEDINCRRSAHAVAEAVEETGRM